MKTRGPLRPLFYENKELIDVWLRYLSGEWLIPCPGTAR